MKKLAVLSLIGLLILAFGIAYAQEKKEEPKLEFKFSGFIDAQFNSYVNATNGNPSAGIYDVVPAAFKPFSSTTVVSNGKSGPTAIDDNVSYWMSRARLKLDAIYGKVASGTIHFEMDSDRWGDSPGGNAGKISERNTYGYWSGDRAAVEVKNAYFDFGVPGIPIPVSMRVGLQPLSIRPWLFLYTDGMGINASIKVDPANISLLYFKAVEGADETADDVNVYGLHANAKIGTVTVGGYGLYYNMNSYPLFAAQILTIIGGTYFTKLINGTQRAEMWWLGFYADGKVGPVNLNLDFIYDNGKVESRNTPTVKDAKYSGWMVQGKVAYPWEAFNVGGLFMYATGADRNKTGSTGAPGTQSTGTRTKVGSYVVPPGSEAGAIYGESVVFYSYSGNRGTTGPGLSINYNALSRGPTGGTWMAKLFGSYQATPWYKVTLQGMYIGDTTKKGNTIGTAVKTAFVGTTAASPLYRDDKDIGWELDLINEIQINKQLKMTIAGGYLWAGDALDYSYRSANVLYNYEPKNPWMITTNLTYNF